MSRTRWEQVVTFRWCKNQNAINFRCFALISSPNPANFVLFRQVIVEDTKFTPTQVLCDSLPYEVGEIARFSRGFVCYITNHQTEVTIGPYRMSKSRYYLRHKIEVFFKRSCCGKLAIYVMRVVSKHPKPNPIVFSILDYAEIRRRREDQFCCSFRKATTATSVRLPCASATCVRAWYTHSPRLTPQHVKYVHLGWLQRVFGYITSNVGG